MEIIVFLSIVIAVLAVLTSIVLVRRVKKQIAEMTDVLVDVKNGNGNRRILSATNELLRNEQTTANAIEWTSIDGVFLLSGKEQKNGNNT